MNTAHPNIAVLQKFNPANMVHANEIIAEDATWHYINPELPELQGDYIGPEGFKSFFQKMAGQTSDTFKVNHITTIPMGDELVVSHVKDTMALKGDQMDIDAVVVWRIVNGKIKEAWDIPAIYTAKILKSFNQNA